MVSLARDCEIRGENEGSTASVELGVEAGGLGMKSCRWGRGASEYRDGNCMAAW